MWPRKITTYTGLNVSTTILFSHVILRSYNFCYIVRTEEGRWHVATRDYHLHRTECKLQLLISHVILLNIANNTLH